MDDVSRYYESQDLGLGTHFALRWKGRVRYTVPRELVGQRACWRVFKPGKLGIPLRGMACFSRLLGMSGCVESNKLESIRAAIGHSTGFSCCRAGAEGVWSKDTILLMDESNTEPLYIAKAGAGEAVNKLLCNEADWLRTLRNHVSLSDHVPELIAHRSDNDQCFVVQRVLGGELKFGLEESHFLFMRRLQSLSNQPIFYQDSRLYRTMNARVSDLSGELPMDWLNRLTAGLRRIEQALSGARILLAPAHNDFTLWNVRLDHGVARVFDWEYADHEQLPLFDPLHFSLVPLALNRDPLRKILTRIGDTLRMCRQWLGEERCYEAETQVLAYLVNLCTLYLWADRGKRNTHPTLVTYSQIIDHMSQKTGKY